MRKSDEQQLRADEMKMLRWSGGVTLKDRVRNADIRGTFRVQDIAEKMRENRIRWYGHVTRRNEQHITRTVMTVEQPKRHSGDMDENYFQGYKDIEFESRNDTCLECRNRTRGRVDAKRIHYFTIYQSSSIR